MFAFGTKQTFQSIKTVRLLPLRLGITKIKEKDAPMINKQPCLNYFPQEYTGQTIKQCGHQDHCGKTQMNS